MQFRNKTHFHWIGCKKLKSDACIKFVTKYTAASSSEERTSHWCAVKTGEASLKCVLLTKRAVQAVLQATRLTKDFYLLVVNRALCHLNDCHLPCECTSYATALINAVVKRCALITLRFETTRLMRKKSVDLTLFSNVQFGICMVNLTINGLDLCC